MVNLPKELEEIRETESNKSFGPLAKLAKQWYIFGFDDCYQAMLKTYTPNEIVKELVKENKRLKVLIAKRF